MSQQRTASAFITEAVAQGRMMADAGHVPHVVHGPYHRLAEGRDSLRLFEREQPLVHPVEAYHVGLHHRRMFVERHPVGSGVDLEESLSVQSVGQKYLEPFCQEGAFELPRLAGGLNKGRVCKFLGHKHTCVDSGRPERIHKPETHHCGSSCAVRFVDDHDFERVHFRCSVWNVYSRPVFDVKGPSS